jgi:predicted metal-dependent peptidase
MPDAPTIDVEQAVKDLEQMTQTELGRWEQAREVLDKVCPLWYYRSMRLPITPAFGWCDTAATDGNSTFFNPRFSATLTDQEVNFVHAHEVAHVVLGHLWRLTPDIQEAIDNNAPPEVLKNKYRLLNCAQDLAIHSHLKPLADEHPDLLTMPRSAQYDPRFDGLSAESIYKLLPEDYNAHPHGIHMHVGTGKAPKGARECGPGVWMVAVDGEGNIIDTDAPGYNGPIPQPLTAEQAREIARDVAEQMMSGGWGGPVPNAPATQSKKPNPPTVDPDQDWLSALRDFIVDNAANDFSWSRPDRSYLSRGIIVPGMLSEELEGVIAIDVSPSIPVEKYQKFCNQVVTIRSLLPDHKLHVIWCDSSIRRTQTVVTGEEVDWNIRFGGGTDFRPVFEWVEGQGINPRFLVYLTDSYGCFPINPPHYPVLWAVIPLSYGKLNIPWGQVMIMGPAPQSEDFAQALTPLTTKIVP